MKIKTNRYGFFTLKSGKWVGPVEGRTFTKTEIRGFVGGKKATLRSVRKSSHRKVKLFRQVWVS